MSSVMDCVKDIQWSKCVCAGEEENDSFTEVYIPAMILLLSHC